MFKHKIVFYILLTALFAISVSNYSCRSSKINKKAKMNQTTNAFTLNFEVSAKTKRLIKDIRDELDMQKILISEYKPSKKIIEKYDFIKTQDTFYIGGMMITDETFDISGLREIGVKIGSQVGNFSTIQIPISSFGLFLENQGIKYFEVSEKTYIK